MRPLLAILLALHLAACARAPEWLRLAAANVTVVRSAGAPSAFVSGGRQIRLLEQAGEEWVEAEIRREDWLPMARPGVWRVTPPFRSMGRGPADTARLRGPAGEFPQLHAGDDPEAVTEGSFALVGTWLVLRLPAEALPPERATLAVRVHRRARAEGLARVQGRRFSGSGFSVWPGERVELTLDLPADSSLRLATCADSLLASAEERRFRFRVTLDGELLLDHQQLDRKDGSVVWHALDLPARGRRGARLVLETSGDFGATSFLAPTIVPRAPAPAERPDILVFLADTFRADNLAAHGSTLELCPNIDALARESLCFSNARSVATYTLPAHGTLFSGLLPPGATTDNLNRALPEEVVTIAESMARAGYRTGAVTGAVIVSRAFGLDQGFEWFDEAVSGMDSTRARVREFLAAGDGRPTFLFVQTYRVHTPYDPDPATSARLEQELGAPLGDFALLNRELQDGLQAGPPDEALRAKARRLEALYRAGVAGLDREFGEFLAEPLVRGLRARGFLLFTSDHGEAFLEHDELYHAGKVYDEQLRIPLLLSGPLIQAGRRDEVVSLADVAPTLAEWAGLEPGPGWHGLSLLRAHPARVFQYAFECRDDRDATVAVVSAEHKLIALLDQQSRRFLGPRAAFDLGQDPLERTDLLGLDESWPDALLEHLEENRARLLEPRIAPTAAQLDAEQREGLRALGYSGD